MASKKNIIDSIRNIATKFNVTDETRLDEDWLSFTIDNVCAELKIKQYATTNILDPAWLSDLGLVSTHRVTIADDINASFCGCDIAKFTIPPVISFVSKDGNLDLGVFTMISACGTKQFYPKRLGQWRYMPKDSVSNLFKYYARINTGVYINDPNVEKVRLILCLLHPEDGKLIQSEPISSGSLVNGTVYVVKFGQIVYNGVVYSENATFTANATTTFTGDGKVYLNSQARAYRDVDDYPASGEMIREIILEVLTKELGIERQAVTDVRNDSKDDSQKTSE
jgi:hypothetical protein